MDEKRQLYNLYTQSFDDSKNYADYFFSHKYKRKNAVTLRQDGKIVSALHIFYKKMQLFDAVFDLPFIVAAATLPNFRGQRLMEKVIFKTFERLSGEKMPFVSLNPFKHSYYEKYGFVTYTYNGETEIYGNGSLQPQKADCDSLYQIYQNYNRMFDCALLRNCGDFEKLLCEWAADNMTAEVYGGSSGCYIVYKEGTVEEFCGDVETLKKSSLPKLTVSHFGKTQPGNMIRIVNLKSALECLHYISDGTFTFSLTDEFYPKNNGSYLLRVKNGKGKLCKAEINPETKCTINELTLAIFCGSVLPGFDGLTAKPVCFASDKY